MKRLVMLGATLAALGALVAARARRRPHDPAPIDGSWELIDDTPPPPS